MSLGFAPGCIDMSHLPSAFLVCPLLLQYTMNCGHDAPRPRAAMNIAFSCKNCSRPLVVDAASVGTTVTCHHCLKATPVVAPTTAGAVTVNSELAELQMKL